MDNGEQFLGYTTPGEESQLAFGIPKLDLMIANKFMYQIPGVKEPTDRSIARYARDFIRFEKDKDKTQKLISTAQDIRYTVSGKSRLGLIMDGLASGNDELQKVCAKRIDSLPKNKKILAEKVLLKIASCGMESKDVKAKRVSAELIMYLPEIFRADLLQKGLKDEDIFVQKTCAQEIWRAPENKKAELKEALFKLVEKEFLFSDKDYKNQGIYAEMIQHVSTDKMYSLIKAGFSKKSVVVRRICANLIKCLFLEQRFGLVEIGLNDEDALVQKISAETLQYLSKKERLKLEGKIYELIKNGLSGRDLKKQKISAEMIEYAPENKKNELRQIVYNLIKKGIIAGPAETQRNFIEMIPFAPEDAKPELYQLAKERAGNALVESALYSNTENISSGKFAREEFKKTGSETTLVGGSLRGGVIVRHIERETFLSWKNLYEDCEFWKGKGFEDYVPIEPIYSFKENKSGKIDVYTGVLDLSLEEFIKLADYIYPPSESDDGANSVKILKEKKRKIIDALKDFGVKHDHAHSQNFCLRFMRDENGKVDFSKEPRIYLIDFDRARFAKKPNEFKVPQPALKI